MIDRVVEKKSKTFSERNHKAKEHPLLTMVENKSSVDDLIKKAADKIGG